MLRNNIFKINVLLCAACFLGVSFVVNTCNGQNESFRELTILNRLIFSPSSEALFEALNQDDPQNPVTVKNRVTFQSGSNKDRLTIWGNNDNEAFSFEENNENIRFNLFCFAGGGDADFLLRWFRYINGAPVDSYQWILGEDRTGEHYGRDFMLARDFLASYMRCKLDGTIWLGKEYSGPPNRLHPVVISSDGDFTVQTSASEAVLFADVGTKKVGIGTVSPGNILTVKQGSATDPIADAWTVYSSRRWKENIEPINGALDKVQRLRGVSYDYKVTGRHDIGLVAEEVAEVIPEVVAYEENGKDAVSVDYSRLVAVLVEAVKEQEKQQQEQIKQLEATIDTLTKLLDDKDEAR